MQVQADAGWYECQVSFPAGYHFFLNAKTRRTIDWGVGSLLIGWNLIQLLRMRCQVEQAVAGQYEFQMSSLPIGYIATRKFDIGAFLLV
jgi:hypothetical protein